MRGQMEARSDISFPFKSDRRAAWRDEEERLEAKTRKKSARLSQSFYGRDWTISGWWNKKWDKRCTTWFLVGPKWSRLIRWWSLHVSGDGFWWSLTIVWFKRKCSRNCRERFPRRCFHNPAKPGSVEIPCCSSEKEGEDFCKWTPVTDISSYFTEFHIRSHEIVFISSLAFKRV